MRRARSFPLSLALALILPLAVAVPWPSLAQISPADEAKRKQLFDQAKQLADEGRWAEAAQPLREVVRIRSAPKALIALAVVERELLHHLEARALLLRASEEASASKLPDDEAAAKKLLAELEPLVPKVELEIVEPSLVLSVFVDDTPALRVGHTVWIDPGKRVLRFEAPGRASQRVTVELAARGTTRVRVDLRSAGGPKALPAPDSGEGGASTGALAGSISLGLGGVGLGVAGAVLMAMGHGSQREVEEACGGTSNCAPSLQPLGDEGARNIIIGDVLVGVGGAALVGGVIWLAVELSGVARDDGVQTSFGRGGLSVLF